MLKPDVVFFGENVPKPGSSAATPPWTPSTPTRDALLVLGSSLTVMSGFRFVRRATKRGVPVVVVNRGATRADDLADREGRRRHHRVPHHPRLRVVRRWRRQGDVSA